jgi:hypothetical protein
MSRSVPRFLVLETISQGGTDLYKFGLDFTRGGRTIHRMSEVAWLTTLLVSGHKRKAHTTLMKWTDLIQRFIIHQLLSS